MANLKTKKKKKEIRHSVKLLWQTTNNIQSLRTEEMQFACFVKVGKRKKQPFTQRQQTKSVMRSAWLSTKSLLVCTVTVYLKDEA